MSDVRRDRITFRLRDVDADLREATKAIDGSKLSELARDGLRLILGIQTTKRMEVTERPISVVERPIVRATEPERLEIEVKSNGLSKRFGGGLLKTKGRA